jgi:hypothetical protein
MMADQHTGSSDDSQDALPEGALRELTDGLILLWRAHNYARDAQANLWDFAIEIQQFYDLGLSINELRWLVGMGYAEHRRETTAHGDARRSFQPEQGLVFSETSALLLTDSGTAFASQIYAASLAADPAAAAVKELQPGKAASDPSTGNGNGHPKAALKPTWDADRRQLHVGGELVKWFRVPAASQEAVLAAFEEESWPDHIDDPLPCVADGVPKQRLNSAIKRLNDCQTNRLIHFHGDGHGEGIGWTLIAKSGLNGKAQPADRGNGHHTESCTHSLRLLQ